MRNLFLALLLGIFFYSADAHAGLKAVAGGTGGGGGSVSVTAGTPDIVITPSPGTNTFTVGTTDVVNAQGTAASYTILSSDMGKTVTHNKSTAVAVTLPQAGTTGFAAGVAYTEINQGAGVVTITPTTSTINGASTYTLAQGVGVYLISDGTNWIAFSGGGGVSLAAANAWLAGQAVTPSTVSISTATFTPNFASSNNFNITLVHASCPCTLANPTNVVAGQSGVIVINQSSTGADLITSYGSSYIFTNGASPTLSTAANATDLLSYYVVDSTHIRLSPLTSTTPSTKFTTSGCSISSTTGSATSGTFTLGANSCSAVITMNGASGYTATNGWACAASDRTATTVLISQSASSTTTATLSIPAGAGTTDVISFLCQPY